MKRSVTSWVFTIGLACLMFTPSAWAVGHYELAWFRMWNRSENGGNGGNHVFQIWVFDESGNRMGNVHVVEASGLDHGWYTAPNGERLEIPLFLGDAYSVKCRDFLGSTSDVTPTVRTDFGNDLGHYSYDAGFIYKADKNSTGDADDTLFGQVWEPGMTEYYNPYTKSMVYSSQYWPDYFSSNQDWTLCCHQPSHSQTFITTNVNRILGVFLFPVQAANAPTRWRAEIREGGPDGALVASKEFSVPMWFAQPLAFGRDDCIVRPNEQYTVKLVPLEPSTCSVYVYPGNVYATGDYAFDPSKDMFGFVWGWDGGIGTHGVLRGTVRDTNGTPIPNAAVTITDLATSTVTATKTTSASGAYLAAVPAGNYRVEVDRPGFSPGLAPSVNVPADEFVTQDFTLTPLVQELTNSGFDLGSLYAWAPYGSQPPQVWQTGIAGVPTLSGSHWAGTVFPGPSGSPSLAGGLYQRVPAIAGESYQAVYNLWVNSGGGLARIGVDPAGGTDPGAPSVQWSPLANSQDAWSADNDMNYRVQTVAGGSLVTVFVEMYTVSTTSTVALENVRLFRTTGPAPSESADLTAGWNLMSVPLVSAAGEPVGSALDDVIAAGNNLSGNLFRYNSTGQAYESYSSQFSNIDQARGYWAYLTAPATELSVADLPPEPAVIALAQGWNLIGMPYRYGTPLSGLTVTGVPIPAWHDDCNAGKLKYRSDGAPAGWGWVPNSQTAIEWKVYVSSAGSTSGSQPRLLIRDGGYAAEMNYDPTTRMWQRNASGMTRTSGGFQTPDGMWHVAMGNDAWHTLRLYYNSPTRTWRITVDGLTDAAHQMEGTTTSTTSSQYVQWGVVSSDSYTNLYTNYVYWGQNAEIDNWPAGKCYNANATAPEISPGWQLETSGSYQRGFTSFGPSVKSMHEAALAGWVQEAPVYYEGGYKSVKTADGGDAALRPGKAYWIKADQTGLTLKLPASAEVVAGPAETTSSAALLFDADGCITGSFKAALASGALDDYESARDVAAPPAGPGGAKEVAFRTTLSSMAVFEDVRPLPPSSGTKVWAGSVSTANFGAGECKDVTVTWNVDGGYKYWLTDVNADVTTPLRPGDSYTFQICQSESLPFELSASEGTSRVDYNEDGHVDNLDFVRFEECANGPAVPQGDPTCLSDGDLDGDNDVDDADFGIFQRCLTFDLPADPFCP